MKVKQKLSAGQNSGKPCVCGAPLPHHLADLADDHFTHICSCERAYKVIAGGLVLNGTEANAFARHDRSEQLSAEQNSSKPRKFRVKTKVDAELMLHAEFWTDFQPASAKAEIISRLQASDVPVERVLGGFLNALENKLTEAKVASSIARVLVCGSRGWSNKNVIRHALKDFPQGTLVIHGGAKGADTLAGEVAHELGFSIKVYHAQWETLGRRAGHLRNQQMLDEGKPTEVIAFDLGTPGTADMIRRSRRAGLRVTVFGAGACGLGGEK